MALFQLPGAERLVARRDFHLVDSLWQRWSPGFTLPADQRAALHACLAQSMPGPIEYYRAALREGASGLRALATPITTPLLALHGGDDRCVLPPTRDDSRLFSGEYVREIMPGLGHFMHVEDPDRVAARIADWACDRSRPTDDVDVA
jgi:pimeloyl-ACP methyl ester carboxylesterase